MTWGWYVACMAVVAICVWVAATWPARDDSDPTEHGPFDGERWDD